MAFVRAHLICLGLLVYVVAVINADGDHHFRITHEPVRRTFRITSAPTIHRHTQKIPGTRTKNVHRHVHEHPGSVALDGADDSYTDSGEAPPIPVPTPGPETSAPDTPAPETPTPETPAPATPAPATPAPGHNITHSYRYKIPGNRTTHHHRVKIPGSGRPKQVPSKDTPDAAPGVYYLINLIYNYFSVGGKLTGVPPVDLLLLRYYVAQGPKKFCKYQRIGTTDKLTFESFRWRSLGIDKDRFNVLFCKTKKVDV
ncbi:hypothetical protein JTE90_022450 [Oedothorax gibbosus]|uniref:Uncharacterized protein n=1 Tax=Oedothorax gibbosus TaxID=931172 RepID=A0AAV6TX93_9ARAC|nr:hypothetical protein JTE90_022450 [Oedothorax gibbosus]